MWGTSEGTAGSPEVMISQPQRSSTALVWGQAALRLPQATVKPVVSLEAVDKLEGPHGAGKCASA